MSLFHSEPMKVRSWVARTDGLAWRFYDVQLTTYAILLTCFGLAMAYSNSVGASHTTLSPNSPFVRAVLWAVVAAVVFGVTTLIDYRWLRTFAWPIYLINIGLLIFTLRFGYATGDAGTSARWITIIPGFQLQFSELAKILMILVFAAFLADRQRKNIKSVWTVIGAVIILGPPWVLVMLQPDLGSSLVIVGTLAGMLFMSGAGLKWLAALGATVLATVPFLWTTFLHDYQRARLMALLNPGSDPRGSGYQLIQAKAAVSDGGPWGKGLTNGTTSASLPVATTDFVWGVLAEELGFIGSMVVLALFVALLWRMLVCSWRTNDPFAMMIGCGLASMILFQVVVNVGMVVGLMPITGIPLPFVSYGGASLVSLMGGMGILQSTNLRREPPGW